MPKGVGVRVREQLVAEAGVRLGVDRRREEKELEEGMRAAVGATDTKGAAERGDKRTKAKGTAKEESFDSSDDSESSLLVEGRRRTTKDVSFCEMQ